MQTAWPFRMCHISSMPLSAADTLDFYMLAPGPYGALGHIREWYPLLQVGAAPLGLPAGAPSWIPPQHSQPSAEALVVPVSWLRFDRPGFNLSESVIFCLFSENISTAGSTSPPGSRDRPLASGAWAPLPAPLLRALPAPCCLSSSLYSASQVSTCFTNRPTVLTD